MRHTNIIVIKDAIILKKAREKEKLLKDIANTTASAERAQVSSFFDFAWKYK